VVVDDNNAGLTFSSSLSVSSVSLYGSTGTESLYLDDSNNLHLGQGASGTYHAYTVDDAVATIIQQTTITGRPEVLEINGSDVYAYCFNKTGGTQPKILSFTVQLPHTYATGTAVAPHFHFVGSTANTSNVTFSLNYWMRNINSNDVIDAANTTTLTVSQAGPDTAYAHRVFNFGIVSATGNTESAVFGGTISRNGPTDSYTGDVYVLSIDLHFIKEKHGRYVGYAALA
jgi:hypothetical protein